MKIDLDDKETRVLLNALRMYLMHVRVENEELATIRQQRADKPQGFCCIENIPEKVVIEFYKDENYCIALRDKLKKLQMQFPAEEHIESRKYDYGKDLGREKPWWEKPYKLFGG